MNTRTMLGNTKQKRTRKELKAAQKSWDATIAEHAKSANTLLWQLAQKENAR